MAVEVFNYRAKNAVGKTIEGTLEAADREEAWERLTREGLRVLELVAEEDDGVALFEVVTRAEIVYLTNQLAVMVDTGVALSSALRAIVEQERNPTLRRVLKAISADVEAGQDFSKALKKHPKYFDETYVALVRASEATGSLGEMLETIAAYQRAQLESRAKIRGAMIYPGVMLCFAVAVTVFLLTYVMPKFMPIFQARHVELPGITKFMMTVSELATGYWWAWIGGVASVVATWYFVGRTEVGRRAIDRLKLGLPLVGPLLRKVAMARSLRTLGTMLEAGVPVLESLDLCAAVAGNVLYYDLWQNVKEEISTGRQICDALRNNPLVPHLLVQMIASGEESGKLGKVLLRVAEFYDRDIEYGIKNVTSMLEPAMIMFMGVVVGSIGMAMMLPIFRLSRHP
ncbi:type II secretion system F family protein [Thermostilla marina]